MFRYPVSFIAFLGLAFLGLATQAAWAETPREILVSLQQEAGS
ncbi:MAG: hypothetical protein PHU06_13875 [Gallionella sp.]|nr:hypothetical protein [Gallionella sp.]MDD4960138.1 hypothetical protein [Gallionella sp.]